MNKEKEDLIRIRLKRADEAFSVATYATENNLWNEAASALYYTCFYLVQALFAQADLEAKTHNGVKTLLALHFIKENKLDEQWGSLLARLFTYRQLGDYSDVDVEEQKIVPLVGEIEEFKIIVLALIEQAGYKTQNES